MEPVAGASDARESTAASRPAPRRSRLRLWLVVPIVAALLLRAGYLRDYRESPLFDVAIGPDVAFYDETAVDIRAGQWLWSDAYHGPFYPFVLALWAYVGDDSIPAIRGLQLLLGVLACLIVTLAVARRCGPVAAGCTAALWALYTPVVYYEAELFAEGTALFLNACVVALLLSRRKMTVPRAALAGLLLGLSAGVHASALLFAAVVLIWLAWTGCRASIRRGVATASCALIGVALPTVPVVIYHTQLLGQFVGLQETGGLNFYVGNNTGADGTPNVRPGPAWDALLELPQVEGGLDQQAPHSRFFYGRALEIIRDSPLRWLGLLCKRAALSVTAGEISASTPIAAVRDEIRLLHHPEVAFGIVFPLALVGLTRAARQRLAPAWLLVVAYVLSQTLFVAAGRYRVPMLPGLFVLAGLGLASIITNVRARCGSGLGRDLIVALLGFGLAFLPIVPKNEYEEAEAALARALAYRSQGDEELFVAQLRDALRVRPGFGPALMLLGEFYEIRGRGDAAIEQYRVAVAAYPEYRLARIKLADSLLRYRGDFAAARPHYLAALAINPAHLPTRWLYARALLVEKDWSAAAEQCRIMLERGPSPPASWGLGKALAGSGRPGDALPHLLTAVRSMPQNVPLLTLLARLRAASFDDAVRDVGEALQYGSLAAGFSQGADARALDALAMALASAGRFAGALEVASRAAHRAAMNGDADLRDEIRARRELYQQDRPYREVPPR